MTVIALPEFLEDPGSFLMRMATVERSSSSPFGGSEEVVDLMNDRWTVSTVVPPCYPDEAGPVEAFIASFRGMNNTINLHHLQRPQPVGTMRGSPTLFVDAAQGAAALSVQSTAGATLLAGDMIGVGGLLLQVATPATANGSGVMVVPIVNRLRRAQAAGTAVVWDRPTAPFRLISQAAVQYAPGYATEVPLDFLEAIS